MFAWIAENIATIVICIVLAGIIAAVVFDMIKSKSNGRSACGCGCAGCPMGGSCHQSKK